MQYIFDIYIDFEGAGIASSCGPDERGVEVRVTVGSGVHPASYPMGTGGSFLGGKAAGA
jgi:hypothetical protein